MRAHPNQKARRPARGRTTGTAAVLVFGTLLAAPALFAQDAPPGTDIHLVRLERSADATITLGVPENVTARPGYDNQPAFLGDGRLLYTSIGDDDQADIRIYDPETKTHKPLNRTPESEFSATPIPGEDAVSVVRVESAGNPTGDGGAEVRQRLWRFPLDGGEPSLLLPDVHPVGYHDWADGEWLALFVLGEPPTLRRARRGAGEGEVLVSDIGRTIRRVPGSKAVSFVRKEGEEGPWTIRQIDFASGEMTVLARVRHGQEDFTWLSETEILMGRDSVLWLWTRTGKRWTKLADLAEHGIGGITRLAVHPDGNLLALVAVETVVAAE